MKTTPIQAECATKIVEVVPFVMKHLRDSIRARQQFTIPQVRVLGYLHYHGQATLSDLAVNQGVSLPTMSKLIAGLVQRKLVKREGHGEDKRKLKLQLTSAGAQVYDTSREGTRHDVCARLARFGVEDQQRLSEALDLLQAVFSR
jgi:DNA-binding MarR family transcriptional regulator